MKVADIASEFYMEWGSPTDMSISSVSYWVRGNVGQLNNAINTHFYIDTSSKEILRINPDDPNQTEIIEIGIEEKDVLKAIWQVYFMDWQIRKNLISYTSSSVIEVTEDGNTVRVASPTEIGRNLYTFRKAGSDALVMAINQYKISKATPRQVTGDDTVPGRYGYVNCEIFRRIDGCV